MPYYFYEPKFTIIVCNFGVVDVKNRCKYYYPKDNNY